MKSFKARSLFRLVVGASVLAIAAPGVALAQDEAAAPAPQDGPVTQDDTGEEIVVTGIRASLRASADIKRDAYGVVDAISAEDIGKFPDTNLAESLQRITGVSIDRSNGEGQFVTVRGFGPEFNLVTLNGRQMPTSSLGDGASAPASRSFDFANLASEGIAGVEVYKTGRASIPSGGIGSSINIRTPRPFDRPGLRGSVSAKAVYDTSYNQGTEITPEFSGLVSNTFADDRIGVLLVGSYQRRKASTNTANVGWRDGYLGSDVDVWGQLPTNGNAINRPGPNDVYQVAQNASYDLNDIDRERINGQAVLQFRPIDSLTATVDYTYSRNTVEVRNSNVGIWFNHGDTSSEWTDGPVAGPIFYSERFGAAERKDLSYSGSLVANRSENKSLGANLRWDAPGNMTMELDFHSSSAESKPTNKYGSSVSVGNAVFGVASQTINFDNDLPVISYVMQPGVDALDRSLITPTGNSFRNAYFRNDIDQIQLRGRYDHDGGFLDSIDFGVSYTENKVRSAYGFVQNESWSGAGPASDIPDDIFSLVSLPDKFKGVSGAGAGMIPSFYTFDFERMVDLIENKYQVCSDPQTGKAAPGTCLADYTVDRRTSEKMLSPYLQVANKFDLFGNPAHLVAGVRYEHTVIDSQALVPVPVGTSWNAANEFYVILSDESQFTGFKGNYQNWLPSIDFDVSPFQNVKLRASYSHTITRADYGSLQGGLTLDSQFRIANGTGSRGNPGLMPFKSKNIDLSAEWYYAPTSYVSVGYFRKNVSNFISQERVTQEAFGLRTVAGGPRYLAAVAALGPNAGADAIRSYIFNNFPESTEFEGLDPAGNPKGRIFALPEDPLLEFQIQTPVNSSQTAVLQGWEFALQHSFWDTGFGVILNYTKVDGDAVYDNTKPSSVTQFALTGLSDSANAVAFYDKNGLQARVAWNWRDKFLTQSGPNPFYIEEYWQIDASASYEVIKGLTAFVEGINLTNEGRRGHLRSERNVNFASPGYARYSAGVRFNF
ncbi:TonB-dependent receptor [Sphingomonas sp. HF-S3]|uniref:TonB-dependent receptor n=1 Tax=Sphingomonas rustica TaxID=3103142 RepID=A0ABV0B503_9SPHN